MSAHSKVLICAGLITFRHVRAAIVHFQPDCADVIGVRHLHVVLVALQIAVRIGVVAGSGLRAVSRFRGDGFR